MPFFLIIIASFIVGFVLFLFILSVISRSGNAPGIVNGKLSKCSGSPNCVCSDQKDDTRHYIDPINIPRNFTGDISRILREAIQEAGGKILTEKENYIAATFSSPLFGFVDDLEVRIDSVQSLIHIRSASRAGYSDLGANKKRAGLVKEIFLSKGGKPGVDFKE